MNTLSDVLGIKNKFQATAPINNFTSASPTQAATLGQANAQAAGGAGPASGTIAQQSALSRSLAAAAQGQGPNPALEQLRQATSANLNSAAGMAASARGVNPALAARMAVDAGSQANQASAGQAATLAAQQQIAARNQLAQNLSQTGELQLGQQAGGTQLLGTSGGLDLTAQGLNQQTGAENARLDLGAQQVNAGVASQNTDTDMKLLGGIAQGVGGALNMIPKPVPVAAASGGEIPATSSSPLYSYLAAAHGRQQAQPAPGGALPSPSVGWAHGGSIHSGEVPVVLSPGEKVLPPGTTPRGAAAAAASARTVPGRAKEPGDSPKNDTVPGRLPAGSIVLPRTVVNAKEPGREAASFVASVVKRSGRRALPTKESAGEQDLSGGGVVHHRTTPEASRPHGTARGSGREETRRRMRSTAAPLHNEED